MQMEHPATDVEAFPNEKHSQPLEVPQPTAEPEAKPQDPGTERSEIS